ncbi:MAG: hypothetical protein HYX73_08135, partial [Acidobacteria bacterium]|nr:hypothetical protein [Acidobacteriota bacterium]
MAAELGIAAGEGSNGVLYRAWRSITENFRQSSYAGYLAIVRILVGYHFLEVGLPKVARGFYTGESLPGRLADATLDPLGWHRAFIFDVVVANPVLFSYLVAFGEVAIAIPSGNGVQIRLNRLYIFLHLLFVFAAAGRSLGLD